MNILFVCTSNKDRSPALERHFREKYPQHSYRSAGINTYFTQKHGTHFLTKEDVEWADLVVGADEIHTDKASSIARPSGTRTFVHLSLGDYPHEEMDRYTSDAEAKILRVLPNFPDNLAQPFYDGSEQNFNESCKLTPEQERAIKEMNETPFEWADTPQDTGTAILTPEQKKEVIHAVTGQIILDYGIFPEMEPERRDMFYTFLGILDTALRTIPEPAARPDPQYEGWLQREIIRQRYVDESDSQLFGGKTGKRKEAGS